MASEPYAVGTVSVANGSTTVTGTDTFWIGKVRKNDMFMDTASGLQARVTADPVINGELAINAWPGPALVDAAYEIIPAADSTTSAARLRDLLAQMSVVEANGRGLFFRFSDQTTDADPGAGYLRVNNPAIGSSTGGYFDNLDAEGASVAAELDTWDDSTSLVRGKLWLRSLANPSTFHALAVTDTVVDGTGYRKLTWSYIGGSGSFAVDEEMMAFFAPKGDRGDGYVTNADVADPSELTPYESEAAGFLVFVTDLGTDFGAYTGRSGVVRLVAGPAWELAALYTGPQGAASTVPGPTGPVGIDWKGPYSAGTAYALNDGVLDNGSSWRALGPTTGNAPPILPVTSNAWWALIARKGTDGAGTGDIVGPAGATDNALARYDGGTGKQLQDSAVTVSDTGALSAPGDIMSTGKLAVYAGASERAFMTWDAGSIAAVIDSDGALEFRTNNTVAARLDTAGRLTIAAQPAFLSSGGATQSGAGTVVEFTSAPLNRGSHYNTSNGRFTAQVAGLYHFDARVLAYNETDFKVGIYRNGSLVGAEANINSPRYNSCAIAAEIVLAAGDYVDVRLGSATSNIYSGYRVFSGHLIG